MNTTLAQIIQWKSAFLRFFLKISSQLASFNENDFTLQRNFINIQVCRQPRNLGKLGITCDFLLHEIMRPEIYQEFDKAKDGMMSVLDIW